MKRVQGAESSTELFGRKRRGFAVFSLPGPGLPHSHSTVLYRTLQKTGWRSRYCYEGAGYRGGEAHRTLLSKRCCWTWLEMMTTRICMVEKLSPQMQKAVPWRQASRKWRRGSRAAFPLPSWIQQQSFPIGLLVLFFKVKKTVTYPTTQACKALAASNMCAE